MDMGIVNAGQIAVYDQIPQDLLTIIEDVMFTAGRRPRNGWLILPRPLNRTARKKQETFLAKTSC